jgi:hypothetical protein
MPSTQPPPASAQEFRDRAEKCLRLAGAVRIAAVARFLVTLARDHEARAAAAENGLPLPRSRWLIDGTNR